jgi:hypothetical protein
MLSSNQMPLRVGKCDGFNPDRLKWQFQPQARSRSWQATRLEQRLRIADILAMIRCWGWQGR